MKAKPALHSFLLSISALSAISTSAHAALVWHLPLTNSSTGSIAANTVLTAVVNDPTHGATNGTVINAGSSWVNDADYGIVWSTVQNNRISAGTQDASRTTGFTWSIWVKADPLAGGNSDGGAEVVMGTRSGTYLKLGNGGVGSAAGISATVNFPTVFDSTWKHISFLGDSTNLRVFVNGVATGTPDTTTGTNTWNPNLELGGSAQFTEDMEGLMRDAAIWNNALTVAQHRGLYTLGLYDSFMYDAGEAQSLYTWADSATVGDTFDLDGTTWELANDVWGLNEGDLQDAGGGIQRFGYGSGLALVSIPEPAAALLGSLGGLLFLRRRRN